MNKILFYLLSLVFLIIILVNVGIYMKFSSGSRHFFKNSNLVETSLKTLRKENSVSTENSTNSTEAQIQEFPKYVLQQVENLKGFIPGYFVKIKNGTGYVLALPISFMQSGNSFLYFLLTFYPLEWEFAKFKLQGFDFFPEHVFLCNGFFLLEYKLNGVFPVQVENGSIAKYGVIAVPYSQNKIALKPFDADRGCSENGFVFNLNGNFSGVCSNGKFLSNQEIIDSISSNCKLIYGGSGYGNLQG